MDKGTLTNYVQAIKQFKVLDRAEEKELFLKAKGGCKESYNNFISHNLKLVVKIAFGFKDNGVDVLDLIQSGNFGLIRSIEKFKPELGFKFSTYSSQWIKQFIMKEINDNCRTIRIPTVEFLKIRKINNISKKLGEKLFLESVGREDIIKNSDITEKDYNNYLEFSEVINTDYLGRSISKDGETELIETIKYNRVENPSEINEIKHNKKILNDVINSLDKREKRIISTRFELNDNKRMTLQEIADIENVSRERIRQLEVIILKKLKEKLNLKLGDNYEKIF